MGMVAVIPVCSTMLVFWTVLKPWRVASKEYVPMGRTVNRYWPSSSEAAARLPIKFGDVTTMLTPGSGAPS